jgi:hypothetical protein
LGYKPSILALDPHDLDDILISIAERVGRVQEGRELVVSLRKRIDEIRVGAGRRSIGRDVSNNKPKILCIEWITLYCWSLGPSNGRDGRRY